jgi:hypothetical protein
MGIHAAPAIVAGSAGGNAGDDDAIARQTRRRRCRPR